MVLFIESKPQDIVETEMQSLLLDACLGISGTLLGIETFIASWYEASLR